MRGLQASGGLSLVAVRVLIVVACVAGSLRADDLVRGALRTALGQMAAASIVDPVVARMQTGETMIAWIESPNTFPSQIRYLVLDRDGQVVPPGPRPIPVTIQYVWQIFRNLKLIAGPQGFLLGFDAALWGFNYRGSNALADWSVFGVEFDAVGNYVESNLIAMPIYGFDERDFALASYPDGRWAVAWVREEFLNSSPGIPPPASPPPTLGIFVQRFNPGLSHIDLSPSRVDIAQYNTARQGHVSLAIVGEALYVAWHDGLAGASPSWSNSADGHGQGVLVRRLAPAANNFLVPTTTEYVVNATTAGDQRRPRILARPDGRITVVFEGPAAGADDLFATTFSPALLRQGGDQRLTLHAPGGRARLTSLEITPQGEAVIGYLTSAQAASAPEPAYLRLDRGFVPFDQGLILPNPPAGETYPSMTLSTDAFGDLVASWRVSPTPTTGTIVTGGVAYRELKRSMITPRLAQVAPGGRVDWSLSSPSDSGRPALLAISLSRGWTPLDRRFFPLALDNLLLLSLQPQGLAGVLDRSLVPLDAQGRIQAPQGPSLQIPPWPTLSGLSIFACFATIDPTAPASVGTLSHLAQVDVL